MMKKVVPLTLAETGRFGPGRMVRFLNGFLKFTPGTPGGLGVNPGGDPGGLKKKRETPPGGETVYPFFFYPP